MTYYAALPLSTADMLENDIYARSPLSTADMLENYICAPSPIKYSWYARKWHI